MINAQEYRFSTFPFQPWGFTQENEIKGIIPDIAKAIAEEAGLDIDIKIMPYARIKRGLEEGTPDITILSKNPDHKEHTRYIVELFTQNFILLTSKDRKVSNLDEFLAKEDQLIGFLRGTYIPPNMETGKKITKHPVKDFSQGLRMLNAGRLDAFLTIDKTALYESKRLGISEQFEFPGIPIKKVSAWLMISSKSKEQKNFPYKRVVAAVQALKNKGVIKKIINRYLETH